MAIANISYETFNNMFKMTCQKGEVCNAGGVDSSLARKNVQKTSNYLFKDGHLLKEFMLRLWSSRSVLRF